MPRRRRRKRTSLETTRINEKFSPKAVDWVRKGLEDFITKHKGMNFFLSINQNCFVKIKVLGTSSTPNNYDNTLVKLLERPKWFDNTPGTFVDYKGNTREWQTAKVGTKLAVNYLRIYSKSAGLRISTREVNQLYENKMVCVKQLQFLKKNIIAIEESIESLKKAKDIPEIEQTETFRKPSKRRIKKTK